MHGTLVNEVRKYNCFSRKIDDLTGTTALNPTTLHHPTSPRAPLRCCCKPIAHAAVVNCWKKFGDRSVLRETWALGRLVGVGGAGTMLFRRWL